MAMYFNRKIYIKTPDKTQIEILLFDKTFTIILVEYSSYNNIF